MEAQVEISNISIPEKFEIEEKVKNFLEKFGETWKISRFKIDVDIHSPKGRKKYSMHAKVLASDILFTAKATGWDIPSTLDDLLDKLGRRIGKTLKKKWKEKRAKFKKYI